MENFDNNDNNDNNDNSEQSLMSNLEKFTQILKDKSYYNIIHTIHQKVQSDFENINIENLSVKKKNTKWSKWIYK